MPAPPAGLVLTDKLVHDAGAHRVAEFADFSLGTVSTPGLHVPTDNL
jgi:hypothetical protein